jgi:hypothetical protein
MEGSAVFMRELQHCAGDATFEPLAHSIQCRTIALPAISRGLPILKP